MFTSIRKHQRWLMTLVAALTIIAFAWLYNTTDLERVGSNIVAKIYGREVMQVDIERAVRNYQLALALGQFELVRDLAGQAQSEDEAANNFIWNLMVMQHEAARLGVEPGDQAVVERIKSLPVFQNEGQFDPVKYSTFMQEQLAPRGFTERQLENVIRDTLRLAGIKDLVGSPALVLPGEAATALNRIRPLNLEILRWQATTVAKDVQVGENELTEAFAARAPDLQVPEKRSVRYVLFALGPDQAELTGAERVAVLQKTATATGDLAQALTDGGGDLVSLAAQQGLEVQTTTLFAADAATGAASEGREGQVVTAAAAVAFRLPPGPGNFEIIQVGNEGFAVIEVAGVEVARPMTLEEARADLMADLIARQRDSMVRAAADRDLAELRAALGGGKDFAAAARAAGVKPEKVSALSVLDRELKPDRRQIAMAAIDLAEGTLGDFTPTPEGGFAVYLASRGELDQEVAAEQRPMMESGLLEGKEMLLFAQWLTTARQESALQVLRPMM